jgi:4-amino-4-deoxy-L-arabinose transferase-like glycosyltransferase
MSRGEGALVGALFLAVFLAVLLTASPYGPTYDEPHYISAGTQYAQWWVRVLGGDTSALKSEAIARVWRLNHEHPPLAKVTAGISYLALNRLASALGFPGLRGWAQGTLAPFRLPSAVWLALAVCAVYLYTRRIWGRRGALFGALALATMPRVVAHAHFAALDIAVASWFFVATALLATALRRNSWWWAVLGGMAFGAALMSKVNAFFLPVLMLIWGLIWYRRRWPKLVVALFLIGPAIFFIKWPWLWLAPVSHFRDYLAFHFRHYPINIWYLGHLYQYAPWHYPFVVTGVATPLLLLLPGLGGIVLCWPRKGADASRALLLFGLLITILPSALPGSPKYNGVRLFLPAFPFLAALAGGGFAWLQGQVTRLAGGRAGLPPRSSRLLAVALGALLLAPGFRAVVATYPYQLSYYNALVGGTAGATSHGFETIYWGQVLKEAPAFLNQTPEQSPLVLVIPKGCIYLLTMQQQTGSLRRTVRFTGDEAEAARADYVVFQAMQSDYTDLCWELVRREKPAYAFRVEDTPLLLAYDRKAVNAALARLKALAQTTASASRDTNRPTR